MERLSREKLKAIKRMSLNELNDFLWGFYVEAYQKGVREGEKEFDDPELYTIVDVDDARECIGEENLERLISK